MKVTKCRSSSSIDVRIDPQKIKKVCPAEYAAVVIFMKIRKINLEIFFRVWIQEAPLRDYNPDPEEIQQAQKIYSKLCKRFEGKTGLPLFLANNVIDTFWSSKLRLEKNLYKYTKDILVY